MSENASRDLPPLNQIYLYLNGCYSIECRYCQAHPAYKPSGGSNGNGNGRGRGHSSRLCLSLETIQQVIRQGLPLGLRAVRLCGGDALTYPNLDALLDFLEEHELEVTLETDGAGLTAERIARLAQMKQARVVFAWSPPEAAGTSAFPVPLDSDAVVETSIRRLAEAGLAPLVIFPVTRRTVHQVQAAIQLAEKAGAKAMNFASIPPSAPANLYLPSKDQPLPALPAQTLSVEEIIAVARKIEREFSKTTRLRLFFSLPPAFRGLHPQAVVEGQGSCALFNNLSLLQDGTIALCGAAEAIPELGFGQIEPTNPLSPSLAQIWRSHPLLLALRRGMPDRLEGVCGRCIMKTACLGYCVAENYLYTGACWGPNWFCHVAESVGLFPASRLLENIW